MAEIDLQPSKLGTKEHWDNVYADELNNFNDFGDEGEVWFGQDSVDKMVSWALENVPPSRPPSSTSESPTTNAYTYSSHPTILEVGTGNGTLLCALAEAGYPPKYLAGIDYSPDAIQLARAVAEQREVPDITFDEADFLDPGVADKLPLVEGMQHASSRERVEGEELEPRTTRRWDLVLDKGTYDAMALAERDEEGKHPCDVYPDRVAEILKPGGYFLITSCNFTREELLKAFVTQKTGLTRHSEIEHRTISFGGVQGNTYCSIAFQKAITI